MSTDDSASGNKLRLGRVNVRPGQPIEIVEAGESEANDSDPLHKSARQIGATLKAYLKAAKELLEGRYANLRDQAPLHMTAACRPIAFVSPDGILIRYDIESNPDLKVFVGTPLDMSLAELAPAITESFLHCPANPVGYVPGDRTITLTLSAKSMTEGTTRDIASSRIFAVVPLPAKSSSKSLLAMRRPLPIVSVRNEFDLMMEIARQSDNGAPESVFLTRTRFRIPVGWEAIELYPPYEEDVWDPALAPLWAENDLLAAVLRRNLRANQFHAIDPNAQARQTMAKLLSDFERLLGGPEEPLHQFIKEHPELLSPTHVRMWSKLPLGNRVTDFVFREPSGDYLLVELEKPSRLLFRNDGQQHNELTHAIDQIIDWRRYIEDNLTTVQRELGLEGITSNPRCLIVIGRSSSLDKDTRRKLAALENITPRLKILTYDDLLATAKATVENLLGPTLYLGNPNTEVYLLPGRDHQ